MGLQNKIVYLNLKYQDEEDNFVAREASPFLVYKSNKKQAYLCPITSKKKKKSSVRQYLVSSPKIFREYQTCLYSKKYPYSYANLNRKIIVKFKKAKTFPAKSFCRKECDDCLPSQ